jgi:hypothetical protein
MIPIGSYVILFITSLHQSLKGCTILGHTILVIIVLDFVIYLLTRKVVVAIGFMAISNIYTIAVFWLCTSRALHTYGERLI